MDSKRTVARAPFYLAYHTIRSLNIYIVFESCYVHCVEVNEIEEKLRSEWMPNGLIFGTDILKPFYLLVICTQCNGFPICAD